MTKEKKATLSFFLETWLSLLLLVLENTSNSTANHSKFQSGNKTPQEISKEVQMIKRHTCLSTKWNRMGTKFVAGLVRETIILYMFSLNITDHFLYKADFILSKKIPHDISNFYIAGLYSHRSLRTDSSLNIYTCITPFQEHNPCNKKGPRNCQMLEKRNSIPMQNTHDLLVGTLST